MKENYIISIKNLMFWHFSSSEIKETLEDINGYFESALEEGISEKEVIERHGEPKLFVSEMRNQTDLEERKRRQAVLLKILLLASAMMGMLISFYAYSNVFSAFFFVIFSSALIWFLAGNSCMIKIIAMTEKKKKIFWKSQIAIGLFFVLLQFSAMVIVPYIVKNNIIVPVELLGKCLKIGIYGCLVLLGMATLVFIKNMLQGNIYLFLCTIQSITMMYGLALYYDYLKRLVGVEKMEFVFMPYLFCIPVMLVYGGYIKKNEKGYGDAHGCTN